MPDQISPPPAPQSRRPVLRRLGQTLSLLTALALVSPIAAIGSLFAPGPLAQEKTVIIPHGATTSEMAALLSDHGAVYNALLFRLAAKLSANGALKAGEYAIPARATPLDIAAMIHEGKSVIRLFTVSEGLTSSEVVDLLNQAQTLTGDTAVPPEGSLLPETYRYSYGDSRSSLIARMQKAMQERINALWAARDPDLPLASPQDMVVMASIVEKETGKSDERPRIAGVFYNRLHKNMRLQSDPTVIYAMTQGKASLNRPLAHEDLSFVSPVNTYVRDGLPPQPICNPGAAALLATAHPEHHAYLYFVANGNGGHAFAADLATHDQNINRWHQILESARP